MRKNKESGIYCIENIVNGKKYIGQSVDIYGRWSKHKSELKNHTHDNDYLQKSWDKYGEDIFKFYVIEFCDIKQLDERECYYIDKYNTLNRDNGYNLVTGGSSGKIPSQETIEKIRKINLGHEVSEETRIKISANHADVSGENNPMYGRHHTDEAKRKVSEANKGRPSWRRDLRPVYCIDLELSFSCAAEAAKEIGIKNSGLILQCCYGNRKTTGGHKFKFLDKENNKN